MSELRPVVLSGGSGTRLWPLSTAELPKQFVPLFSGRSLFDLTLERLSLIDGVSPPVIVAGSGHLGLVRGALSDAGVVGGRVVVEPVGRNTAPAALAAALIGEPSDVLVIVPSDHLVADAEAFGLAVGEAVRHARGGGIVTFGVQPSRPETGYGYIEIGERREEGVFEVTRFKEKPDAEQAAAMVGDGRHLWNSGMFVAQAGVLLDEAATHRPAMVTGVKEALSGTSGEILELGDSFAAVEADSIDYAIMEQTERALVIPVEFGWDDVGSYRSLHHVVDKDDAGNHIDGAVTAVDVTGSLIRASSRTVVVAGLDDVVVVETPEAVLVVPLDRSQDVRDLSRRVDRD